jgi:hypothetical protein
MIGWGNAFTGFERRRGWCWRCRNRHKGHWRWYDPRDAKGAAKYRREQAAKKAKRNLAKTEKSS